MTPSSWRPALLAGLMATALVPAALAVLGGAAAATDFEPQPQCTHEPGQSAERCPTARPSPDPHASRNPHASPSPSSSPSSEVSPPADDGPQPDETGCRDIAGGHANYYRRSVAGVTASAVDVEILLGGDPAEGALPAPACPDVTYTIAVSDALTGDRLATSELTWAGSPVIATAHELGGYARDFVRIDVTISEVVRGVRVVHDTAGNDVLYLGGPGSPGQVWK